MDEAFEEWNKGLLNGYDRLQSFNLRGMKWRKGDVARQRYICHKALIQRIERAALNLKLSESDIAH